MNDKRKPKREFRFPRRNCRSSDVERVSFEVIALLGKWERVNTWHLSTIPTVENRERANYLKRWKTNNPLAKRYSASIVVILARWKETKEKKQMKEKRIGGSREGAGRFKIIKQLPVFYQILMFYVFKRSVVAMFDDGEWFGWEWFGWERKCQKHEKETEAETALAARGLKSAARNDFVVVADVIVFSSLLFLLGSFLCYTTNDQMEIER